MSSSRISVTARIPAPAEQVYAIIADYEHGHPSILPPEYFEGLWVEQGGVGEGTVIGYRMRAFGSTRTARSIISEPEPGRVLVEADAEGRFRTTFRVEPRGPDDAEVTFTTDLETHRGILGRVEGWLAGRFLRRVYVRELGLLAARVAPSANATAGA